MKRSDEILQARQKTMNLLREYESEKAGLPARIDRAYDRLARSQVEGDVAPESAENPQELESRSRLLDSLIERSRNHAQDLQASYHDTLASEALAEYESHKPTLEAAKAENEKTASTLAEEERKSNRLYRAVDHNEQLASRARHELATMKRNG